MGNNSADAAVPYAERGGGRNPGRCTVRARRPHAAGRAESVAVWDHWVPERQTTVLEKLSRRVGREREGST